MTLSARLGAALVVLAGLTGTFTLALSAGSAAQAATTNPYQVTLVARECPQYTDIMANLARNNIQESQQDLGPNSVYKSGQAIAPAIEAANDPACTPLNGWQFTFGNGINGQTPGVHLSRVSNPASPPVTVQSSVPLLDAQGNPTGQSIAAATTVTLTQAQVTAAFSHQLWVQGGTPTDPLGMATFGNRYAFGALRCAIDNLNGDNVEWVGFPSGQTNVFCYYYAVDQTPAPGTIVVQKQLDHGEPQANTFQFQGNVSYNPGATPSPDDNPFEITVPASGTSPSTPVGSISFVRSSGVPWHFTELPNPGWSAPGPPVCSGGTTTIAGPLVTLTLAPGSTVVCTYTDSRPDPAPSPPILTVLKQTTGSAGGPFNLSVTGPSGPATPLVASTTAPDQPVAATNVDGSVFGPPLIPGGLYTFSEDLTSVNAVGGGRWAVANFNCDGVPGVAVPGNPNAFTFTYTAAALPAPGDSLECMFTNNYTPAGSLTITKTTTGGVGTTDFVVTPVAVPTDTTVPGDTTEPVLTATTTQAGVPVTATQTSGSPLNPLDLGQYSIVEQGPQNSLGAWAPVAISCNGASTDPTASDVLVTLTAADPNVTCAFTNAFTPIEQAPSSSTTVPTPAAPAGPSLAATGTDVRLPLALAVALALFGSTLLVIDRIRRRRPATVRRDDDPSG